MQNGGASRVNDPVWQAFEQPTKAPRRPSPLQLELRARGLHEMRRGLFAIIAEMPRRKP